MPNPWAAVKSALRDGTLVKPVACEDCQGTGPLVAHHHKGYGPDDLLNVKWLCRSCHRKDHASNPRLRVPDGLVPGRIIRVYLTENELYRVRQLALDSKTTPPAIWTEALRLGLPLLQARDKEPTSAEE